MVDSDYKTDKDYEDVCFVCHRTESVTGKMFHLPNNITICNDCMHATMDAVNQMDYSDLMKSGMFGSPFMMPGMGGMPGMDGMPGMNGAQNMKQTPKTDDGINTENKEESGDDEVVLAEDAELEPVKEEDEKEDAEKEDAGVKTAIPRFSFINLADFPGEMMGGRPKIKKRKKGERKPIIDIKDIPAPHKIKSQLDEYVVGQEHAKKVMSVAVYNHYKRVATDTMDDIEIEKSNMLMIGPTGCGKTYLVKTLAKLLDVPLAITDATSLTEAGYIGDDIESVVSKLLAVAGNDVDKAEQGIIFVDEIDKIAKKQNSNSRDVSGESVQQGMLKLLEGADIEVPIGASSKNAMVPTTTINTKHILFICAGAFPGLEEIIKQRLKKQTSIGFNAELKDKFDKEKNILQKATIEDIRKFGMIPEFIGRLPMMFALEGLTEEMLVNILQEPKNAILKQYQKLLQLDEVNLKFTEDALKAIAQKAMEREIGARALRAVIDEFMLDIMYEIPKDDNIGQVTITKEYIEGTGGPVIELREG